MKGKQLYNLEVMQKFPTAKIYKYCTYTIKWLTFCMTTYHCVSKSIQRNIFNTVNIIAY